MKFLEKLSHQAWMLVLLGVSVFFLCTHLFALVKLPVFADEAIYIRWSQLIMDDAPRYLFFPLNDGKTPIFIWTMIPFLQLIQNQLFAGRLVSVFVGLAQMLIIKELAKAFGAKRTGQLAAMVAMAILPFWFLYHRMALMDSMMTLWLSLSLLCLKLLVDHLDTASQKGAWKKGIVFMVLSGVTFGLALLTKLPALFFGPVFVLISIFPFAQLKLKNHVEPQHAALLHILLPKVVLIGVAGMIGLALFFSLKLEPAFGQLFARGEDFTYSTGDLIRGDWISSVRNVPRFLSWLSFYFSPMIFLILIMSIILPKTRKNGLFLILGAVFFAAPFVIFGKVVYPRYLLPCALFITINIGIVADQLSASKRWVVYVLEASLLIITLWSLYAVGRSLFDTDHTPFVPIDREQYLTEWSSGHGVAQAVAIIQKKAQEGRVVVATEGYFGTLPDGVLLYLHNQDVNNIEVFGIGAPVRHIPDEFFQKAAPAKTSLLLVNSHRMEVNDQRFHLIARFTRPYGAPSFDVYEFEK